jgi:hypothetical protein
VGIPRKRGTPGSPNENWPDVLASDLGLLRTNQKPMSTTTQSIENGTDSDRQIDHDRFVRACTQDMTVTTLVPNMKMVTHNGDAYDTDLVNAVCECPDCQYRNVICKHLLKAALGHDLHRRHHHSVRRTGRTLCHSALLSRRESPPVQWPDWPGIPVSTVCWRNSGR